MFYKVKHVSILEEPMNLDYFLLKGINLVGVLKLVCGTQFICFVVFNCAKKYSFLFLFTIFIALFQ